MVLPDHAPLEGWGDARPRTGVRALVQPTLRPLYDTRAFGDAILDLGRALSPEAAAQLPAGSFRGELECGLGRRGLPRRPEGRRRLRGPDARGRGLRRRRSSSSRRRSSPGEGELTLLAFPHPFLGDGSGAALPLLQEIPDPTTHVAWDSWAEVSLATAERLGVELGDVLRLETSAGAIELAAFPRGGIRDDVIAVPTGQGHTVGHFASKAGQGMPDVARGVNVAEVLPGDGVDESGGRAWLTEKPKVDGHRPPPPAAAAAVERQQARAPARRGDHARGASAGTATRTASTTARTRSASRTTRPRTRPTSSTQRTFNEKGENTAKASAYRWGMTVDLDRCTGCSACIAACYVENNLPRVGEDETRAGAPDGVAAHRPLGGRGRARCSSAGRVHPSSRAARSSATPTSATRRSCASTAAPRRASPSARSSRPTTTRKASTR